MAQTAKPRGHAARNSLQPGEVRPRPKPKNSQAHSGVSPLHPVSHRNTSFEPLPRPLGLPPWCGRRLLVSRAGSVFDEAGRIASDTTNEQLRQFVEGFVAFVRRVPDLES